MLDGLRVVDMTRLLPGPYATQMLSDLGADVVKVESPSGDFARQAPPYVDGVGGVFSMVNRGKRSVELDLKDDDGLEAFRSLVDPEGWGAGVVVEGFRPGVADRLGVGYDDVRGVNDDVVYCSLTGHGQTGEASDDVGHDLNYVAHAGLLDMTRGDDGEPTIPGYPIGDMSGGLVAALSVVSAVLGRELGDAGGEYIDISMTDAVLSLSQAVVADAVAENHTAEAGGTSLTGGYACYDVYETADGEHVTLAALEPRFWYEFCETVDRGDLAGDHPGDDGTREELEELFGSRTAEEWERVFEGTDVPFRAVRSLGEALGDPDVRERVVRDEGAAERVGFPAVTRSGVEGETDESLPGHGEHTEEVLLEAGLSEEEIEDLGG